MNQKYQKLTDLVKLCEDARAPDRNLDSIIYFTIKDGVGVGYASSAPAFTASLDAAMTLVPARFVVNLGNDTTKCWAAVWRDTPLYDGHPSEMRGETLAIALTGAALRAMAAVALEAVPQSS